MSSIERFAIALYDHGFLKGNGTKINDLLEYYKELSRDEIEAAYIAAKMERNKVKKHFAYFLKLDRVQIAAQEYFNDTYGDGIPKT